MTKWIIFVSPYTNIIIQMIDDRYTIDMIVIWFIVNRIEVLSLFMTQTFEFTLIYNFFSFRVFFLLFFAFSKTLVGLKFTM